MSCQISITKMNTKKVSINHYENFHTMFVDNIYNHVHKTDSLLDLLNGAEVTEYR
jgi:hypothetical protein